MVTIAEHKEITAKEEETELETKVEPTETDEIEDVEGEENEI